MSLSADESKFATFGKKNVKKFEKRKAKIIFYAI
jgi:hypothetical protein